MLSCGVIRASMAMKPGGNWACGCVSCPVCRVVKILKSWSTDSFSWNTICFGCCATFSSSTAGVVHVFSARIKCRHSTYVLRVIDTTACPASNVRAVVYYDRVAHSFSAEIKCRHPTYVLRVIDTTTCPAPKGRAVVYYDRVAPGRPCTYVLRVIDTTACPASNGRNLI